MYEQRLSAVPSARAEPITIMPVASNGFGHSVAVSATNSKS